MSQLPAIANRQSAANTLSQTAPKAAGSGSGSGATNALMQRTSQDMVALSKKGLDLSAQGLSDRTDALGNATVDVAQDLLGNMARQLFGDGASINFDSVDLSASSGYAAQMASYAGPNGRAGMAGFSLAENAHFIGKGTITTADGQSFEFEIEVQYESKISASAQYQSQAAAAGAGDEAEDGSELPSVDLPKMDFAGSLSDLFKMLGQQLRSSIYDAQAAQDEKAGAANEAGSLTLRLLDLVQQPKAQATPAPASTTNATPEEQARAQSQAKALAQAYGAPDGPLKPSA
ncbi:hypothetical protein [Janthinobacterium aquaticum]|uniref:hypothetical protein n=1 Tax=Janthinobacterium sp. FT58W TaxID=2654254 RepID=UPI0012654F76|nr:hypothetical protein [Janthinobacterium sp. FT58W]KAB8042688.1 hypothetical protein GCM43_11465 [Janthinobacterium sp. FT58W]